MILRTQVLIRRDPSLLKPVLPSIQTKNPIHPFSYLQNRIVRVLEAGKAGRGVEHTLLDDGDVLLCEDHLETVSMSNFIKGCKSSKMKMQMQRHTLSVRWVSLAALESCRDDSSSISKIRAEFGRPSERV
jgi:hypothetical protein